LTQLQIIVYNVVVLCAVEFHHALVLVVINCLL